MNTFALRRFTASASAAAALLAACGGSQAPIGAPGAMPQGRVATPADRRGSWMLPEATGSDLIYVSDDIGNVYVYSYPQLKRVGHLEVDAATDGLCVDKSGNVFVPAWNDKSNYESWVYEYAHGGTQPIATLNDSGAVALSCSVDPTTGNLAVTNLRAMGSDFGNVEIYPNASGSPTKYYPFTNDRPGYATYDDEGNLFVDGYTNHELAELPLGSSMFLPVTLNPPIGLVSLWWNNGDLITAGNGGCVCRGPEYIYRIQISGSYGTVIGTTTLISRSNKNAGWGQYFIQGKKIIGPGTKRRLQVWHYPRGGAAITTVRHSYAVAVVLSVAPSR